MIPYGYGMNSQKVGGENPMPLLSTNRTAPPTEQQLTTFTQKMAKVHVNETDSGSKKTIEEEMKILHPKFGCKIKDMTYDEFIAMLKEFANLFDVMEEVFPGESKNNPALLRRRVDWSSNYVLNPEFFDENLKERITNSILVAALLVTITASTFLNPPDFGVGSDDVNYRTFNYSMYLSTLCFIGCILLGISFIEDGMDRHYTTSDRIHATLKFYLIKDIIKCLMLSGSILLAVGMILTAALRNQDDTNAYGVILGVLAGVVGLTMLWTARVTTLMQSKHIDMFTDELCDKSSGKIKKDIVDYINQYNREEKSLPEPRRDEIPEKERKSTEEMDACRKSLSLKK